MDRQLDGAIERLRAMDGGVNRAAVHEARKHLKKAGAVLSLVRSSIGSQYAATQRRLRITSRQLGSFADAWAVVDTLDQFQAYHPERLPADLIGSLRAPLIERAARFDRLVVFSRLRDRTIHGIAREQGRVASWRVRIRDREVRRGVADAHRRAASAMRRAFTRPTAKAFHRWRQCVKTEWYLLRLVSARCGGRLDPDLHRLEALDGCLGEVHNVSTLLTLIAADSARSRQDTARGLRALHAYRRALRRRAHAMGRVYAESSGHLAARIREAWDSPDARTADDGPTPRTVRTGPWPRVA
jgi:CHAD domain-containing protein